MIWDTLEGSQLVERIFDIMTIFFGAVALMTLSLGGIGVMNIMLVAVTERTREIGVRKSLGATAADIRNQFFAESAALMIISGGLGLAIGVGFCLAIANVQLPDIVPHPVISPACNHRVVADAGSHHDCRRNVSCATRRRTQSHRVSAAGVGKVGLAAEGTIAGQGTHPAKLGRAHAQPPAFHPHDDGHRLGPDHGRPPARLRTKRQRGRAQRLSRHRQQRHHGLGRPDQHAGWRTARRQAHQLQVRGRRGHSRRSPAGPLGQRGMG